MKRELILWICITILFGVACFEGGFILGKWEDLDRDAKLAKQETKIAILQSDVKIIKERLRMP